MTDARPDEPPVQSRVDPPRLGTNHPPVSSYTCKGPRWWQASDHKWYPPQHHPDYVPPSVWPPLGSDLEEGLSTVETSLRFFPNLSWDRKIVLGGAAALVIVTTIVASITACYFLFFPHPTCRPNSSSSTTLR